MTKTSDDEHIEAELHARKSRIHVDKYGDWIRVYVDGVLHIDEHSTCYRDWLEVITLLGVSCTSSYHDTDDDGNVTHSYPIEHWEVKR